MSWTYCKFWKLVNLTRREYIYPADFGCDLSLERWNHPDTAVMRFVKKNWPSTDLAVVVSDEGDTMWLTAEMAMRGESPPDAPAYYHLGPFYSDLGGFMRIRPDAQSSERVANYYPKRYRPKGRVEAVRWVDTPECREVMARWFEKHGDMFVTYGSVANIPTEEHDEVRLDSGDGWVVRNGDEWVVMTDDVFTSCYEEVP